MRQWAHARGIHWSYRRTVKWPLEDAVIAPKLHGNTLQGWDKVLQKAVSALNRWPINT